MLSIDVILWNFTGIFFIIIRTWVNSCLVYVVKKTVLINWCWSLTFTAQYICNWKKLKMQCQPMSRSEYCFDTKVLQMDFGTLPMWWVLHNSFLKCCYIRIILPANLIIISPNMFKVVYDVINMALIVQLPQELHSLCGWGPIHGLKLFYLKKKCIFHHVDNQMLSIN